LRTFDSTIAIRRSPGGVPGGMRTILAEEPLLVRGRLDHPGQLLHRLERGGGVGELNLFELLPGPLLDPRGDGGVHRAFRGELAVAADGELRLPDPERLAGVDLALGHFLELVLRPGGLVRDDDLVRRRLREFGRHRPAPLDGELGAVPFENRVEAGNLVVLGDGPVHLRLVAAEPNRQVYCEREPPPVLHGGEARFVLGRADVRDRFEFGHAVTLPRPPRGSKRSPRPRRYTRQIPFAARLRIQSLVLPSTSPEPDP
jgi:hypothetical protein